MARQKPLVLAFCRPYLTPDFSAMFAPLGDRLDVRFLTDGKNSNQVPDTRKTFYAAYHAGATCAALTPAVLDDIVDRCRLLRCLPRAEAERRVHAIAIAFEETLDQHQPDLIFTHLIDEYTTATLFHLGKIRGLPTLCYAASYFPGRLIVATSQHGVPLSLDVPPAEIVDDIMRRISPKDYRADYSQKLNLSLLTHLKGVMRYAAKRAYFEVKRHVERDPLHMHYVITPYLAERKNPFSYPRADDFSTDWRGDLGRLTARPGDPRPIVFLPLAYYPEASTNYWVKNRRILDYDACILRLIAKLSASHIVLVKEHTHMLGLRDRSFLRALMNMPNVVSVPATERSNLVLEVSDAILLGSGSAGVEAALRDKPIISYCETSYWFGPSGATFLDLDRLDDIDDVVADAVGDFTAMTEAEKRQFIETCLSGTMTLDRRGDRWPIPRADDLGRAITTALGDG